MVLNPKDGAWRKGGGRRGGSGKGRAVFIQGRFQAAL